MRVSPVTTTVSTFLFLAQGGCAATWAAAHWQEVPIGNGFHTDVTPLGEQESRLVVELHPGDPAPDEVEQPPPEALPLPEPAVPPPEILLPAPPPPPRPGPPPQDQLVGPPYGTQPLRFACTAEQRASREQLETRWAIWDVGEKLVMGLVGLFEASVATALLYEAAQEPTEEVAGNVALASALAVDALGLFSLIALTRPTWQASTTEQPGRWRATASSCPDELRVVLDGHALPVDTEGLLDPNQEAWLVRELVLRGGAPELRCGQVARTVTIDPATRCRWAAERGLPAPPLCDLVPAEPAAPERAVLVLEQGPQTVALRAPTTDDRRRKTDDRRSDD